MTMKLSAFNKLKKTMMMTTSPNDNEALAALRIANRVIAEEGYTWDDVFHRLVKVSDEIEAAPVERTKNDEKEEINTAFATLEQNGFSSNFITSLAEQWEDKAWLSQAQKEALFKTASKSGERRFRR